MEEDRRRMEEATRRMEEATRQMEDATRRIEEDKGRIDEHWHRMESGAERYNEEIIVNTGKLKAWASEVQAVLHNVHEQN